MIADVIFFKKTDTLISRIIARVTNSDLTHVGLIIDYDRDSNIVTIVESNRFMKTKLMEVELNNEIHVIYSIGDMNLNTQSGIVEFAMNTIGTGYDYMQIIGLFFSLVFKGDRSPFFNTANKYTCSKLIDLAYIEAQIKRNNMKHIGNVTPSELLELYPFEITRIELLL